MSYKSLLNKIDELRILVGDWNGVQPSQLEMDMALDRVKKIYEILRFSPLEQEPEVVENEVESEQLDVVVEYNEEEDFVTETISVVVEEEIEPVVEEEEVVEETSEEEEVVCEKEDEEEMILDIDILKSASKEKYNKILSLYCDLESQVPIVTSEPEPEPEPEPIPEPEPEPTKEEAIEKVSEAISEEVTTTTTTTTTIKATSSPVNCAELYKISSQLGINDRFLLANDLFGGDISALSEALTKLDELTNIDDVMIYIAENYKWDGDSEGAKLLFTLLQNRFL